MITIMDTVTMDMDITDMVIMDTVTMDMDLMDMDTMDTIIMLWVTII